MGPRNSRQHITVTATAHIPYVIVGDSSGLVDYFP